MKKEIEKLIKEKLPISLGLNKQNEIIRLIFEILKKNEITISQFLNLDIIKSYLLKQKVEFSSFKKILLQLRYPETIKND
ncbi:hypothetical protein KAU39_05490, partial [bacterium]|nr:hypothetical protein [bacterium]